MKKILQPKIERRGVERDNILSVVFLTDGEFHDTCSLLTFVYEPCHVPDIIQDGLTITCKSHLISIVSFYVSRCIPNVV